MPRLIFNIIVASLVGAAVFIISRYLNTFFSIHILIWGTVFLYFLSGIGIRLYYNTKQTIIPFTLTTVLLEVSVMVINPNWFYELWMIFFIALPFTCGYLVKSQKLIVMVTCVACLLTGALYTLNIYPSHFFRHPLVVDKTLEGKSWESTLTDVALVNKENKKILLKSRLGSKPVLVEFYFSSCLPCIAKRKTLEKLNEQLKDKIDIVLIDNGDIDSFESFHNATDDSVERLYDSQGILTKNLHITSFPFEVLIDKKGRITRVEIGYNKAVESRYLASTIQKINSLSNE